MDDPVISPEAQQVILMKRNTHQNGTLIVALMKMEHSVEDVLPHHAVIQLRFFLRLTFSRTSSLSVSKNWCKALQKRRKEYSSKRNTHHGIGQLILKGIHNNIHHGIRQLILKRNSFKGTLILKKNSSNGTLIKWNTRPGIGTLILKRNTHTRAGIVSFPDTCRVHIIME